MTSFFDAFPTIKEGNFNFLEWVGAIGAAIFNMDDNGYLVLRRFINPKQAEDLPEFEGETPEQQTVTRLEEDDSGDLPF